MKFQINTTPTMKPYNNDKYFIMSDYIKQITIVADTLTEALKQYTEIIADKYYIEISNNALKRKSPMYRDTKEGTKQIGYVLTGRTEFQNDKTYSWTKQYIDLWAEIHEIRDIEF